MTTMPGTLQRPWPPGTYEAAHATERDEARAAEWRQAYDELGAKLRHRRQFLCSADVQPALDYLLASGAIEVLSGCIPPEYARWKRYRTAQ